jgi:CDGSH-type Zn-finger protein/uncharacterized Fe-S cluster protein YjdI
MASTNGDKKIVVVSDGPYRVEGDLPLVRKTQVVSEQGEPLTWKKLEEIPTGHPYQLCRCGHSHNMPFCDETHEEAGFDGTEKADTGVTADRQILLPGSTKVNVKLDSTLCMESGFCGNMKTDIMLLARQADDVQARTQMLAMIEHCPSGAYTYSIKKGEADIEPDLPQQVAVSIEITSTGPITGPLWVTGGIPIERSDGEPFETRNRVTLCSCGLSEDKPLCDGTHRHMHVK